MPKAKKYICEWVRKNQRQGHFKVELFIKELVLCNKL